MTSSPTAMRTSATRLDGFLDSIREFVRPSARGSEKAYRRAYRCRPYWMREYGIFNLGRERPPWRYNIDIVAVHGLGGDWEGTWADENGKLWLRDSLQSKLPDARVLSFGYDSRTFTRTNTSIEYEAAQLLFWLNHKRQDEKRPIVFVCHDLGGIIVKKALIRAREQPLIYKNLLGSVRGCAFFGVPHRGTEAAVGATLAAKIIKLALPGRVNTNFVGALQRDSKELAEISKRFAKLGASIEIEDFDETVPPDSESACARCVNLALRVLGKTKPPKRIFDA